LRGSVDLGLVVGGVGGYIKDAMRTDWPVDMDDYIDEFLGYSAKFMSSLKEIDQICFGTTFFTSFAS
jgi:hypothetical protein